MRNARVANPTKLVLDVKSVMYCLERWPGGPTTVLRMLMCRLGCADLPVPWKCFAAVKVAQQIKVAIAAASTARTEHNLHQTGMVVKTALTLSTMLRTLLLAQSTRGRLYLRAEFAWSVRPVRSQTLTAVSVWCAQLAKAAMVANARTATQANSRKLRLPQVATPVNLQARTRIVRTEVLAEIAAPAPSPRLTSVRA